MNDTKELILEVAYDMFLYKSYESVTFTEICKATKLTKGAVYHYFSSKEELLKAVVQRYFFKNQLKIDFEKLTLQDLIKYTIDHIEVRIEDSKITKNKALPRHYVNLLLTAYRYYPDFKEIGNTHLKNELESWKKVIENSIKAHIIRADIDTGIIALNFLAIFSSLILAMTHDNSLDHIKLVKRQVDALYNLLKL